MSSNDPSLIHLKSHIQDLESTALNLELEGDEFVLDMEKLEQDFGIPEKLITDLKTLEDSLDTLDEILDMIIIIPQITIVGLELKKSIEVIKKPIHKANAVLSDCDPLMKKALTSVTTLKLKIKAMDQDMEVKRDRIARLNKIVIQTEECIAKLPEGELKQQRHDEINQTAQKNDKQIKSANHLLLLLDDSLERINQEVEQINDKMKYLKEISSPVDKIIFELNLITVPLKPIKSALSHNISVPYEKSTRFCKKWGIPYPCGWEMVHATFSVEEITSGLSGLMKPVEAMLKKETDAFLKPRLKSLHFESRLSSIPGLDSLSTQLQALFSSFIALPKEIDTLIKKAEKLEKKIDDIHAQHGQWQQIQEKCYKT